jgi:hypothetical protein
MNQVTTTGNATLIVYDGKPLLATDPWFGDEDPAYFGSWVLSHRIPRALKDDILKCEYIWFSHGHPDHLNPVTIERFKGQKILLPNHVNGRILKDLQPGGYDLTVLPDRKWVQLTDKVRVQCITTRIQDSILLVDSCGSLFINTNDAGTRDCTRYIRSIASRYERSYLLALSGYGDADMINFFDEQGNFLTPRAARKPSVGGQLTNLARAAGAKAVIPFSAFHQYQRTDSMWAEAYTTPMDAFKKGLSPDVGFIPAFSTVDCRDGSFTSDVPEEIAVVPKAPEEFGDNWSDVLEAADVEKIEAYFARKDPVQDYFGFVNFRVGGRDHAIGMRGPKERGISFAVPRGSLITCIDYRIFDDLLIGNYMKTTLHGGVRSLQEGGFNYYVAKYGDNGLAETDAELQAYLAEYRRRAGFDYIVSALEDKSRDFVMRFAAQDSRLYKLAKSIYMKMR